MRAATSVLALIGACVVTAIVSVSVVNKMNTVESASVTVNHTHEALSTDFSAEASQLVVSRA
jgi:hypothetical protein